VLFAVDYDDADALLEELIARHSAPRKLTVVSSDRRLQRAARRRKARVMDSQAWYEELLRMVRARNRAPVAPLELPDNQGAQETEYWLRQFSDPSGAPLSAGYDDFWNEEMNDVGDSRSGDDDD
jgi:hypothetical protein